MIMPEGFHPFPSRTRKLRPPGPIILGAQAPGNIGHRQVNKQNAISNEVAFLCFVVGRMGSHTAGVCVTGRSVAKSSSAFRVRSTLQEIALQVAVWRKAHPPNVSRTRKLRIHTAGVCVIGRSVAKGSFAFRSRADNTWGASPWEHRIHTARVFVMSRSVAIGSSAYRIAR